MCGDKNTSTLERHLNFFINLQSLILKIPPNNYTMVRLLTELAKKQNFKVCINRHTIARSINWSNIFTGNQSISTKILNMYTLRCSNSNSALGFTYFIIVRRPKV